MSIRTQVRRAERRAAERTTAPQVLRVLTIDRSRLMREALTEALGRRDSISIVGASGEGADITRVHDLRPDFVLVRISHHDDIAMLRALAEAAPEAKIVALGVPERESEIIACAEAGAAGYLPPEGSLEDLVVTLRSLACGEMPCSPRLAGALFRRLAVLAADRGSTGPPVALSAREREIIQLIDAGRSNKEIARSLSIEVRTVKNHVHNILEKLQVHRRADAAAKWRKAQPFRRPARPF